MEVFGALCFGLPILLGWFVLYLVAPKLRSKLLILAATGACLFFFGVGITAFNDYRDGPVLDATERGDPIALRKALDAGGSPNAGVGDDAQIPALVKAVDLGSRPCVELLLQRGADPNVEAVGDTPLQWAKRGHREDLVELLKRWGARAQ